MKASSGTHVLRQEIRNMRPSGRPALIRRNESCPKFRIFLSSIGMSCPGHSRPEQPNEIRAESRVGSFVPEAVHQTHSAPIRLHGIQSRGCFALQIDAPATVNFGGRHMSYAYKLNEDVRHQPQGPQGRAATDPPMIYTIVQRMPIEADGRLRYRIKSKSENIERVVTEDQLSYSQ